MIYKSYCAINIEYYPFDIQDCYMKFGTWSNDGGLINLEHIDRDRSLVENNELSLDKKSKNILEKMYTVEKGIDLSDYYQVNLI
jgi:hypothetical protein